MEEEEGEQGCPCGNADESRTHIDEECELYKEEPIVLENMRKIDGCDMEKFGTLNSSEKTIAVLGDGWWPHTAEKEIYSISNSFV